MKRSKIPIIDIVEKLSKSAKVISEDIKARIPVYLELLKTLANIGKNLSLDVDKGFIKVKEEFINNCLKEISTEDKGLKSIKISCKEGKSSFFIEFKKFLFEGVVEIPFTVESFIFNREKRVVTFKLGSKKLNKANSYYSKIMSWFALSMLSIFYKKDEILKKGLSCQNSILDNRDGSYTIYLNKIPDLRELFNKGMANIRYSDLIEMDKLLFEEGLVILRLSRKHASIIKKHVGFIEVLPAGRLIRPLLNRF